MILTKVIPPVRVEEKLKQQVDEICERKGIGTSEFVREALRGKILEENGRGQNQVPTHSAS